MKANVLIAASAGTGKAQALAERLIALVKGGLEWGNYFQCGYPKKAFDKVNWYVRNRLYLHFNRKSQRGYVLKYAPNFYSELQAMGLHRLTLFGPCLAPGRPPQPAGMPTPASVCRIRRRTRRAQPSRGPRSGLRGPRSRCRLFRDCASPRRFRWPETP